MDKGILYVVFNKWITNPETHDMPYKIGITNLSVDDRYYGLGLKMPGKFEIAFAYELDDYAKAEKLIHGILYKYRENGEWFNIDEKELDLIKANCETMGGKLITNDVVMEIKKETDYEDDPEKRFDLLFVKTLQEYEEKDINIVYKNKAYIKWETKKMNKYFSAGSDDIGANATGSNERKYQYLFDVRQKSLFFELCPYGKDTKTIDKMNQIAKLDNRTPVSPTDKYRRTNKKILNINTTMSDESIVTEFKSGINSLLKGENEIVDS
jgi:hypothetical protein